LNTIIYSKLENAFSSHPKKYMIQHLILGKWSF